MNIALVGPTDRSIWIFRRGLIRALVERGHRITVICSGGNWVEKIKTLGVLHIHVPFSRFIDPLADLKYILRLYGIFRKNRFDLIHNFTVKPNIYSTMAARMAGIRNIVLLIEGLGFAYDEGKGIKARLSRNVLLLLYRIACLLSRRTWFINKDDLRLFVDKHIITESKSVFIKSVGVDAEEYSI